MFVHATAAHQFGDGRMLAGFGGRCSPCPIRDAGHQVGIAEPSQGIGFRQHLIEHNFEHRQLFGCSPGITPDLWMKSQLWITAGSMFACSEFGR